MQQQTEWEVTAFVLGVPEGARHWVGPTEAEAQLELKAMMQRFPSVTVRLSSHVYYEQGM